MQSSKLLLRTLLAGGAFLIATIVAQAQAVLIVNGSSGTSEPDTTSEITTNLSTLHTAVGNVVTVVDALPGDISGYKQVWDIRFSNVFALTGGEQAQYLTFLQGGGGMFLMGENSGFMNRNNSIFAFIALAGGGVVGFDGGSDTQTVHAPFTGPNAVAVVNYAASGGFDGNGTGDWITSSGPNNGSGIAFGVGTLSNATAGALTTILDVNFMQNLYDLPNSQDLTKNLIGYVGNQVDPQPPGAVPEPSTYGLMGAAALFGFVMYRRRKVA